ncbi:MAG: glutamate--tRNA ligase [Clostridiales bacterium]|nr:glutamate--tRNA ligase [Clostridiales bacterium]
MDSFALADRIFPDIDRTIEDYLKKYEERSLPEHAVVTRYAPSPTGFIHMGALYASFIERIFAKQTGGVFYLRIEDTDRKRTVPNGIELIIEDLKKFGVEFDEGPIDLTGEKGEYGPYIQTRRKEIYHTFVKHLIRQGKAYPCFCGQEELELSRKKQKALKEKTGYWGKWAACRRLGPGEAMKRIQNGEKYIIRLRSEGGPGKKSTYPDLVKGNLTITENDLDIVILKADGYPTYHFAHLVDDTLMRTTHVIRADEWVASLPIHLQLFSMFGLTPPKYAHISPLLKNDNGSIRKLSKRKDPELAISYYFEVGVPVEAVLLYLATIANSGFENWYSRNPTARIEEFTFSFSGIGKSGAIFDLNKLRDISKSYIGKLKAQEVYEKSLDYIRKYDSAFYTVYVKDRAYTEQVLNIDREKANPRKDIAAYSEIKAQIWYMYDELFNTPWSSAENINDDIIKVYLDRFYDDRDTSEEWLKKIKALAPEFGYASEARQYKKEPERYRGHMGDICEMLRYLLTAQNRSLDLYSVMRLLKKDRIRERYQSYVKWKSSN